MVLRRLMIGVGLVMLCALFGAAYAGAQTYPPTTPTTTTSTTSTTASSTTSSSIAAAGQGRGTGGVGAGSVAKTGQDSIPVARLGIVLISAGGLAVYAARKRSARSARSRRALA